MIIIVSRLPPRCAFRFSRPVRRHRGGGGGGTRRSGGPRCRPRPIFAGPARAGAAVRRGRLRVTAARNAKKQHKQKSSQSVTVTATMTRIRLHRRKVTNHGWPPHTCISTCIILCSLGRSDVRAVLTLVLSSTLNIQVQLLMTLHTMLSESMSHCPLYRDSFQ